MSAISSFHPVVNSGWNTKTQPCRAVNLMPCLVIVPGTLSSRDKKKEKDDQN